MESLQILQVARMVRDLKIIPYKPNWGNRIFSSQRNRHMRRFNRFSYFWKIIVHLFSAYFVISSSEGSISMNFGSYRKLSLATMRKQKPGKIPFLTGALRSFIVFRTESRWTLCTNFTWDSLVWKVWRWSFKFISEYFVIPWKISHVSPGSADQGLTIGPFSLAPWAV